ncbi:MAG: hypothetical protein SVZ03_01445 [Spirochaetota bacterium]|nr:hypothetical protein [Spirochaetota bacterium]
MTNNKNLGEPKPVDAATVILMRDNSQVGIEIFFMQRHHKQAFMGGMYVFPGGKLDKEDSVLDLDDHIKGFTFHEAKSLLNEPELDDEVAVGLFVAAIRETFEESGALMALRSSGEKIDFSIPEVQICYNEYRKKIHNGEMTMKDLAEKEGICFTIDLLTPYAHLITPEGAPKRYNTRFLLAQVPEGQRTIHDSVEMTDSLWTTASGALEKHYAGEIVLSPPTLMIVEEMSNYSTVDQLLFCISPDNIHTVLLQHYAKDGESALLYPHDPDYTIPEFKIQSCPEGKSSRVVLKDGIWRTMCVEDSDVSK